jgi:hypothetical protein
LRTAQYGFILIAQAALLCVMFTFGTKVIDYSREQARTPNSTGVQQPPSEPGLGGLRQYLSH